MNLSKITDYFTPSRILDIGANVGQFHSLCKSTFPDSYVFSVEASNECEHHLKQVTENYYIGLLAKNEENYKFYSVKNLPTNTGNSIYKELSNHYSDDKLDITDKKGVMLDNLFSDEEFDLIKIDTQGSELDIISGGLKLCSKAKGILLEVSLVQYNENAPVYDDVIQFMEDIGFEKVEVLGENFQQHIIHQQDILFIKK